MVDLQPSASILSTQIALAAAIERHAVAQSDLDGTTLDLLLRIAESPEGRTRAVELCRQLQLSAGYLSKRIDAAVGAGLVERRIDDNDRRSHTLTLTDAGRAAVEDFRPRLEAVLERVLFDNLTERQRATLITLLGRVESACLALIDDDGS